MDADTPEKVVMIRCRRCKADVAKTDGTSLRFEGCRITSRVHLHCSRCGAVRQWRPGPIERAKG